MPKTAKAAAPIHARPVELLQQLIRFDTTNPPGDERECIQYIDSLMKAAGIKTALVGKSKNRPNLVARLKGRGEAAPLLLYGHVDVVTTASQKWQHPPFAAEIADGFLWGRGALDMKSGVAMMLAAFLKARAEGTSLPGDVIFCAVADEENGANFGARYLVEQHPELFQGVRYAFGEFGGFNLGMNGKRVYPIMVAEKQLCWMKLTFRGQGGHGSMPVRGQAMAALAQALKQMDEHRLPYHLTQPVAAMIDAITRALGGGAGAAIRALKSPVLEPAVIAALGERAGLFAPLLHNTVSPTVLQASDKVNVIPSEVALGLDGRLLPGLGPDDMRGELGALLGKDIDLEVAAYDPGPAAADLGLFDTLGAVLRQFDPQGTAVPYVAAGVTDARFFSRLGIQTYGFTPLRLPDDFNFMHLIHAADERVPVDAIDFGVQVLSSALQQFK